MKYFKIFDHHSEYETYINSEDKLLPNISYCEDMNDVHFNHYFEPLSVKYNVTDISVATQLYFYSPQEGLIINGALMFDKIEIDNVEVSISDIDTAEGKYQFSTSGEHVAKYTLKDPTIIGPELDMSTGQPILLRIGAFFGGCITITEIKLPNSVTSIVYNAFGSCSSLTNITIPNSVTSIGDYVFQGCTILTNVTIPNSVTSIGEWVFLGCTGLTSVTIPNSVTSIGTQTFQDCTSLTSITIPNSVTTIGSGAFQSCSSLTSITIPNSVTSIDNNAFYGCTSLANVIIGNNVTYIGSSAFRNCTLLISVTIQATTPPTISGSEFLNNASGRKIYVPAASVEAYKAASGWSTYADDIVAIS